MTITIHEAYTKDNVILGSKDKRFKEAWGEVYKTHKSNLFQTMEELSTWCNNELHEELLFDVE